MTTTWPASRERSGRPATRGTMFVADRVVTLGHARMAARAVVVRGSRVVWVGDDPDAAPPHHDRFELPGCVIGPAFVDAHAHLTPTGLTLTGLDLREVTSGAELLRAVATFAEQHTGRVIWGHGFDPHRFPDELPSPDALAQMAGGRAVYLSRVDGHACLVDRATLAAAPLSRAEGIEMGEEGPSGSLRREANHIVRRWALGAMAEHELAAARRAAAAHAAALGIASVHEMGGPDIMGLSDLDAWIDGPWPIEIVPYWGALDVSAAIERDLRQVGGDVFLDGSLGSHTAALLAPYEDRPDHHGHLEVDDATLLEFLEEAVRAGLQTAVHAIGDAAITQIVQAWATLSDRFDEEGRTDVVRRGRHRIEHAEVLSDPLVSEIAQLGLTISAQPSFEAAWGGIQGMYGARLGAERVAWTNPFRTIADHGIGLAFGSDSNVTPMDPWATIHAAEHRAEPRHAVSRLEAVSMSTLGGRSAARQDRYVGVVRAGMRADLAAFVGDPYAADDPRGTPCVLTLVGGRVAHGTAPLPDALGRVPSEG
ncbi:MAG: amidohydrolase family protein [Nitriliruptoraceae bacterium]|nr:amidohydrolase family protein [Nitriliruptoraceae bacterium]